MKEYHKKWYQKNKGRARKLEKEYRQKPENREKRREYLKKYREKNREKLRERWKKYRDKPKVKQKRKEYSKEYRKKNKDRIRRVNKIWYQNNQDKIKAYRDKPEVKAKGKEYRQGKHFKEYQKEYRKNPRVKERYKKLRKIYIEKNKDKIKIRQSEYRRKMLEEFISTYKKGKCCAKCGYNKHPEILQFHHKDEKKKSFTIARKTISPSSMPLIKKEMDKCILLCPNCHRLIHLKERK